MNGENSKIQGIQSVENAFWILDLIKDHSKPLTLSEIAYLTNMSKSRVHKYLISFMRIGALDQDRSNYTYSLGTKLLEYGMHLSRNHDIIEPAEPYMRQMRNELKQTVALNIWIQEGPMVVTTKTSQELISVDMKVGYRPPLYQSATGRCFLAFMEQTELEDMLDGELADWDTADRTEMENELEEIRRNGYAFRGILKEEVPGSIAVSCPVFNGRDKITAVVSVIGFSGSINTAIDSIEVQKLKEITSMLSEELL